MARPDITRTDVERTLLEFDRLGRDQFLDRYGYGPALRYFLVQGDRKYDSKAIAGVAHQVRNGTPLRNNQFTGGAATVVRQLEGLGFVVLGDHDEPDEAPPDLDDSGEAAAFEGRVLERRHLSRERNQRKRAAKVAEARRLTGRVACEVCGFDFAAAYGERGAGFIECHHRIPLHESSGMRETLLADLALICSNCHRMVHRRSPWLTVEELTELIRKSTTP